MFRTRVSWADGAVLLTVLVLALLLVLLPHLLQNPDGYLLVTTENGSRSYPLSEDQKLTVTSNSHALTLEIRDGKAHVLKSDCPDKICMHSGWIGTPGQSVICAPAGVRLLIVKDKGGNADADFIAG